MPDRESVIRGLEPIIGCAKQEKWGAWIDTLEDALELLKDQPQIVRCHDCKHAGTFDGANGEKCFYCTKYAGYILNDWVTDGDFFCADGERK